MRPSPDEPKLVVGSPSYRPLACCYLIIMIDIEAPWLMTNHLISKESIANPSRLYSTASSKHTSYMRIVAKHAPWEPIKADTIGDDSFILRESDISIARTVS